MHASRPYEYFEDAFTAWLDGSCGGHRALRADGYDFVIAESRCSYFQPARLDELVTIDVRPDSASTTAFTIALDMTRNETAIAAGAVTYVTVRNGRAVGIPSAVRGPLGNVAPGGRCSIASLPRICSAACMMPGASSTQAVTTPGSEPYWTLTCAGMYPAGTPSPVSITAFTRCSTT